MDASNAWPKSSANTAPFPGLEDVHGVSFDGRQVWFASGEQQNALAPDSGELLGALNIPTDAGTAFDGRHLFRSPGRSSARSTR